jgi:lysozyme
MNLGLKGEKMIKQWEQLRLVGYMPTPNDRPTIGFGSTRIFGRPVVIGEKITEAQAEEQFQKDISWAVNDINKCVTVQLNQNQFDALVSFIYNIGAGAFKSSTLLRLLNAGDYVGASNQFGRWNKQAGKELLGLTRRRNAEKELFVDTNL